MSKTMIIRIMVPRAGEDIPEGFIGHYDIQFPGSNQSFKGESFNDITYSFEPKTWTDNNSDSSAFGFLHVFNGSQSSSAYTTYNNRMSKCDVYKVTTTVSDAHYTFFCNTLASTVTKYTAENFNPTGSYYTFPSGNTFHNYNKPTVNCFLAVATWLNWMGIDILYNIYDQAHDPDCDYLKYSAGRMVQKFSSNPAWSKLSEM